MGFMVKEISNKITKIVATMIFVLLAVTANSTNVYAEELQNAKSLSNENYVLTIEERGGVKEQISGESINLSKNGNSNGNLYDDSLLKQSVDKLLCLDESKIIESKNPLIEYVNGTYVLRKEIYGTRVNKDVLYNSIANAVKNNVDKINLDSINCYIDPSYTTTSEKVLNALNTANTYISANITYNYGGYTKNIDYNTFKDWISIDSDYNVNLDTSSVSEITNAMAEEYTNGLGRTIYVSGGYNGNNPGWAIDADAEASNLISLIQSGQTISTSPAFYETGKLSYLSNVGDTFVDVDLANQYLYYYKDGYIVAEGNLVSGNMSNGCATPAGSYSLNAKQTNTSLVGPNYVSPVAYWMPFIGNSIGLHDASWRSEFGGNIYMTNGSHGCVNLPYSLAQQIYNNISVGTPIICHY